MKTFLRSKIKNTAEAVEVLRKIRLTCEKCAASSLNAWGGQMMTNWQCFKCGGRHLAASTAHDVVCKGCAIDLGLCQWCGEKPHMYREER